MRFHYIARGIIFVDGRILLAHQEGADNTFLPGGYIESGEKAEVALIREIGEEIGLQASVKAFIGAVEAGWTEGDQEHHEICLLFELTVPELDSDRPPQSREAHLEFLWAAPDDLAAHNLLPESLLPCLMNWRGGYHACWGSSFGRLTP